jgi:ABC-type sugar transport system ATPase subunit
MDEPTASFTQQEAERLFEVIRRLSAQGTAILYISHRLEEVLDLSDRITVFRDGRRVDEHARGDLDVRGLARAIAGIEVAGPQRAERPEPRGEVVFEASNVALGKRVHDVNLQLRAGEVLGVAGLVGAGRTEFVRAVAGAERIEQGEMRLGGRPYAPRSPAAALARGVALVPEERRSEALILDESVAFNVALAAPDRSHAAPWLPIVTPKAVATVAQTMIDRFRIKTDGPQRSVRALSGGNQQKVVISRFVAGSPRLLILDEPTVGVDVGAREEIYRIISELASGGTAVIVVSSDFDELQICDRVIVFREGRTVASLPHQQATKSALTHLCFDDAEPEPATSHSSDENGQS